MKVKARVDEREKSIYTYNVTLVHVYLSEKLVLKHVYPNIHIQYHSLIKCTKGLLSSASSDCVYTDVRVVARNFSACRIEQCGAALLHYSNITVYTLPPSDLCMMWVKNTL